MAFDANNNITGLKVDTIANLGAYMSLFSSSVPTYLYATLLSGQYTIPAIHCNVRTVYTNTRSGGRLSRRGPAGGDLSARACVETAARELGVTPAELRRQNFIREFPYQTPVIMCYDAGDFEASLDAAMKAIDYDGFPARRAEAEGPRQETRHRHELLHRGLRHCAVGRRSARWAPAWAFGNRPRCGSMRSARSRF
jgi:carbon-monoxide dehydrogenase large subunit